MKAKNAVAPNGAVLRSSSLDCLHSLVDSLRPEHGPLLDAAAKMANGLPSLDWFPTDLDAEDLRCALARQIDYTEEVCEEENPTRPAPCGDLKGDSSKLDKASIHLRESLAVGLTPANLYAGLLMLWCGDELEAFNVVGASLRDPQIPVTIIARRIHDLSFLSGFNVANPTHRNQYRDSSRSFIVESKHGRFSCERAGVARRS